MFSFCFWGMVLCCNFVFYVLLFSISWLPVVFRLVALLVLLVVVFVASGVWWFCVCFVLGFGMV